MRTINAELYRSALIKTLEEMEKAGDSQTDIADGVRRALRLLDMQDSVDAVEVVRCKDCKWFELRTLGSTMGRCENPKNGLIYDYTDDIDYCSYGERKE